MHDGMLRDQRGRCEWDKPVCSGNIRKLQQRVVIFAVAVGRNQDGRRPAALHAAQRLHRRRGNASSIYGDAK